MHEQRAEGWKEIAEAVNRSARTCQAWARRTDGDRLPVFWTMGTPCLDRADFERWMRRQKRRRAR